MQATLERQLDWQRKENTVQWLRADEAFPELSQEALEETYIFLGGITLNSCVQVDKVAESTTLLSALQEASFGDLDSWNVVYNSVYTDLVERMFKSKNETKVTMQIVNNKLVQNGRPNVEVLGNTFRYSNLNSVMYKQALAEQSNAFLFDLLIDRGVLDSFDVLVASATPTDKETRRRYNFFEETDTMSLQLLSKDGDIATLHTGFVAGKVSPDAPRHDIDAVKKVATNNGVDLHDFSAEESVRIVLLIPKGNLKNGVTSLIEQYDQAVGGTFYGENEAQQDYFEFSNMCLDRDFNAMASSIANQLINEAHKMKSPMDPIRRLNELSGAAAVRYAVVDDNVDERIFGKEAAPIIKDARTALKQGKYDKVDFLVVSAVKVETSSSCPIDLEIAISGEDNYGSREFSCPHCNSKNFRSLNTLIENCQTCGLSVRC